MPETTIDWFVREGGNYIANLDDEIGKLTSRPLVLDAREACDLRVFADVLTHQARALSDRASKLTNAADTYTGDSGPWKHAEDLTAEVRAGEHREDEP